MVFICNGRGASGRGVLLGAPYEDNDFRSSISSSMVAERNLRSSGDDSIAYVVPGDAIFFQRFRCVLDWF
jgi:hypothetical protein